MGLLTPRTARREEMEKEGGRTVKEEYQELTIEVIELADEDIVTTSGFCQGPTAVEGSCQMGVG